MPLAVAVAVAALGKTPAESPNPSRLRLRKSQVRTERTGSIARVRIRSPIGARQGERERGFLPTPYGVILYVVEFRLGKRPTGRRRAGRVDWFRLRRGA